jgi:hypothetical protein
MSDLHDDLDPGFLHPRIAVSDRRTGAVIDLPELVAVALLESESSVRRVYEKHFKMAGQWMAPPELRQGRLIVIDQELAQRVLRELPAGVLSELRAEFLDGDEPEHPTPGDREEERLPETPMDAEQLPLDRYLKELMGDQYDPDSPTFISPRRGMARQPRHR